MRYRAAEKLEIIRLVEQSPLSVRQTFSAAGNLPRDLLPLASAVPGARRGSSGRWVTSPRRVWNKLPEAVTAAVIDLPLKEPELSPQELAAAFVDQPHYCVPEASVYRLLKARGLITTPAFILLKAADHFAQPTTAINQLWQTDFSAP